MILAFVAARKMMKLELFRTRKIAICLPVLADYDAAMLTDTTTTDFFK